MCTPVRVTHNLVMVARRECVCALIVDTLPGSEEWTADAH